MPIYKVKAPDGSIMRFEGPENATQEQIIAAAKAQFESMQTATPAAALPQYGARPDGTQKGRGFLGPISLPTGGVATEYTTQSDAVTVNGQRIDFPTLVPTLTPQEIEIMRSDIIPNQKPIPEPIMQKAIQHANSRLSSGLSVFADQSAPAPTGVTGATTGPVSYAAGAGPAPIDLIRNGTYGTRSGGQQTAQRAMLPEGFATLQEVPGGGRLVRAPDGSLSFTSPSFSTTDPEFIAQIQAGKSIDEAVMAARNKALLSAPGQMAGAIAASAQRGVPYLGSYGDEAASYVVPGGGERYNRLTEALTARNPGLQLGAELAGGIASSLLGVGALGGVPRFLSMAQRGTRASQAAAAGVTGAGFGLTEGAIYGAGEGEEGKRIQAALTGAKTGAIVGGALGPAAVAGKAAIEEIVRRYKGLDIVQTRQALEQNFGRPIDENTARALQTYLRFEDFDNAERVLQRIGDPSMLADISPGIGAVLDAMMAGSPVAMNAGRQAVEGRVTRSMRDLGETFDRELGQPLDPEDIKIGIAQETSAERDAAYRNAWDQPIDYASQGGQELENLFERVRISSPESINEANKMMAARDWKNRQIKVVLDADGNVTGVENPPDVLQLDYITRELNDKANSFARSGQDAKATLFGSLSREIRDLLKDQVPAYGAALRAGQDKIRRQEAIDLGFDLIDKQMSRGEIARQVKKLNSTQRKELARGLRSRIDEEMSNIAQIASDPNVDALELRNVIKNMSSDAFRTKLTTALGHQKAQVIIDQIEDGLDAMRLRAAVSMNSKTAPRQAVTGEIENIISGGILQSLKRVEPAQTTKLIFRALTGATEEAEAVRRSGIYEEMTQVLTQIRGQNARDALTLIRRAMEGQPLKDSQARLIANVITMPSAAALYAAGRPAQEQQ